MIYTAFTSILVLLMIFALTDNFLLKLRKNMFVTFVTETENLFAILIQNSIVYYFAVIAFVNNLTVQLLLAIDIIKYNLT